MFFVYDVVLGMFANIVQGATLNVTYFKSEITHLLHLVMNITEHGYEI